MGKGAQNNVLLSTLHTPVLCPGLEVDRREKTDQKQGERRTASATPHHPSKKYLTEGGVFEREKTKEGKKLGRKRRACTKVPEAKRSPGGPG